MRDEKLSPTHDIELLKQKITLYKDTLTTLKTGDSIEDYQFLKNEFQNFKSKITNFADVIENMDEKQNRQIKGYKQEIKNLSAQIDSLNLIVEELNQNFLLVMKTKSSNRSTIPSEGKPTFNLQNHLNPSKKQTIQKHSHTRQPPSSNATPSYKQLQNILTRLQSIEELPIEKTVNPKPFVDEQPPISTQNSSLNSGRRFNELHKNNPPKLLGNRNQPVPTKRISIKFSNVQSFPLIDEKQKNDSLEKESIQKTESLALIEPIEEPVQKIEEAIPVSMETEQEDHHKEPLSILRFFRKR